MSKRKISAKVIKQEKLLDEIYDLYLETDLAGEALPGQFVCLYSKDGSMLLPRPISICQAVSDEKMIRLVYRVAGKGTKEFSNLTSGDDIEVLGVLGNGFPIEKAVGKRLAIMGGGIGIPPMLQTLICARERLIDSGGETDVVLGYRSESFLLTDFESVAGKEHVFVTSDDGTSGIKGNVLDAAEKYDLQPEVIFACGPMPMLRAIKAYAEKNGIEAYISLEERMACGVGACLGCVCKTSDIDEHSKVRNSRICTDGPVYLSRDVLI